MLEKQVAPEVVQQAIKDLEIETDKRDPAIS
jgi:hypothetical protein